MKGQRCTYHAPLWLATLILVFMSGLPSPSWACRLLEPPPEASDTFWVHLDGLCFTSDQQKWAIKGNDVLESLQAGKSLDIQGALIVDDVMLDLLPLKPVADLPAIPPHILDDLQQRRLNEVRVIPGAISIRNSQFEKVFATNLVNEVLVVLGEVNISGTTFSQSMDFSKIIFVRPLVFSNVNVEHEGFFIGTQFEDAADFSHAHFGTHSRFHKAVFRGPAIFTEVEFQGVAEFLEVTFQDTANFSQVKFLSGTGFSGSVFHGPVDFSETQTRQEMYFRFSEFKKRVSFHEGKFQSVMDFSNSHFDGEYDFSETEFTVPPEFTGSNIALEVPISGNNSNQFRQWVLFGGLAILVSLYLWIAKRGASNHTV